MTTMHPNNPCQAACLTPSTPGGIAVIQVVGINAVSLVAPLVKTRRPLAPTPATADRLQLCRIIDHHEVVDEGLLAVRSVPTGQCVVDLNVHGGPRVMQRVLLMLKNAGAHIVEPNDLSAHTWPAASPLEREGLLLLQQAATRPVATWLIRAMNQLPAKIEALTHNLLADDDRQAQSWLRSACEWFPKMRYLLEGIRVTVLGAPNAGKSTLINCLTRRDAAITHPAPGTTRDWTEHHAVVDGLPFSFVDTAGLRQTRDPLEQEAIRRAQQQISPADVVLLLIDRSAPLPPDGPLELFAETQMNADAPPVLTIWSKSDLPAHPSHGSADARTPPLSISAATGAGLERLGRRIIETLRLAGWQESPGYPFTIRQAACCRQALSALADTALGLAEAAHCLQTLANG